MSTSIISINQSDINNKQTITVLYGSVILTHKCIKKMLSCTFTQVKFTNTYTFTKVIYISVSFFSFNDPEWCSRAPPFCSDIVHFCKACTGPFILHPGLLPIRYAKTEGIFELLKWRPELCYTPKCDSSIVPQYTQHGIAKWALPAFCLKQVHWSWPCSLMFQD